MSGRVDGLGGSGSGSGVHAARTARAAQCAGTAFLQLSFTGAGGGWQVQNTARDVGGIPVQASRWGVTRPTAARPPGLSPGPRLCGPVLRRVCLSRVTTRDDAAQPTDSHPPSQGTDRTGGRRWKVPCHGRDWLWGADEGEVRSVRPDAFGMGRHVPIAHVKPCLDSPVPTSPPEVRGGSSSPLSPRRFVYPARSHGVRHRWRDRRSSSWYRAQRGHLERSTDPTRGLMEQRDCDHDPEAHGQGGEPWT